MVYNAQAEILKEVLAHRNPNGQDKLCPYRKEQTSAEHYGRERSTQLEGFGAIADVQVP